MLTVEEFAKHLDTAFLSPKLDEAEIRRQAGIARDLHVATFYSNTCWTWIVAEVLKGSDVNVGAACSFPHGSTTLAMKRAELEEACEHGATCLDLVCNTGAIKSGDWDLVQREIGTLRSVAGPGRLAKLIIETCFLTDDELVRVVKMCSASGIDYAKSGTNAQGKSVDRRVRLMLDSVSGTTKVKVSALPDTFMMAAVLHMIDEGVGLFGTMHTTELVNEYRDYLAWKKRRSAGE